MVNFIKEHLVWLLVPCICLTAYSLLKEPEVKVVEKQIVVEKPVLQDVVHEVTTKVVVKEKAKETDADLVYNSKDSFKVSLNGREVKLTPSKGESFDFKENYIDFKQTNSYKLTIENKPLEPSWGIGVGVSSNKKLAGLATARIKDTPLHVWGMTDGHTTAVGVMFSANYK